MKNFAKEFANDLENVTIVSASANRSKGSKGPSEWTPTSKEHTCVYAQKWTMLLSKYNLTPTYDDSIFLSKQIHI